MPKSELRTKVALLRATIGVSVGEFAELIKKSIHTVKKLESGRLALGEQTAFRISEETGVDLDWLINPQRDGPPVDDAGHKITPESFEWLYAGGGVPSHNLSGDGLSRNPDDWESLGWDWAMTLHRIMKEGADFNIAYYRSEKFRKELEREFLARKTKAAGSKKPRP